MSKSQEPRFYWDSETFEAMCVLTDDNGNTYVGTAKCHEDDLDFGCQKDGCIIAMYRANIKYFQSVRDNEIKPALKVLKELYHSMDRSYRFNPNSYENKMIQIKIQNYQFELDTIKEMLVVERKKLKTFIDEKEKQYQKIRNMVVDKNN